MLKNLMYLCFVAVMFASCGDDTEDCSAGLYGDDCENRLHDLYIGTWSGDDCDGDPYSIVISGGDTAEDIVILNGGLEIQGKATSQTMFDIPTQTLTEPVFQLEVTIVGDGTLLEDGTISFTATVTSAFGGGTCTNIMTKQ
ncbi:hypothetical protein N9C25_06785 [Saprospiraceae bacterium]|nr:hypothetical protein [Saprospiraceae bacterium]